MKKSLALVLSALLLLSSLTAAFAQEEKVLNLFTWATYIDDATVAKFTELTGIKVNYTNFESNEEMLIKMASAGTGYDVIIASDYAVNTLRKDDKLLKLDKSLLPNYANLDPAFLGQYYDETDEYTVPYTAGTPLIVYNPALVDPAIEITGYESLWDERLKDSIVVIDDARNIIGITLKTLGYSFNTTDPQELAQAREKLFRLRPNIRVFNYNTPHQDLINGEVSVGYMFTPFVLLAMDGNPDLKVVYPEEGMGFGIDSLVVVKDAPHPGNAHALLNFLLNSEVAANTAAMQYYLSPVASAYPLIPEYLRNNPAINIPKEILGETEFIKDVGEHEKDFQAIWAEFKLISPN
ncbi:MAG: spermidine/putrescine ABC transporter substrate-binding protein [Christensenellales bacterium]